MKIALKETIKPYKIYTKAFEIGKIRLCNLCDFRKIQTEKCTKVLQFSLINQNF